MSSFGIALLLTPLGIFAYAYVLYPLLLRALAIGGAESRSPVDPPQWPRLTITVPAYNAEASIRAVLENLIAADYPAERRQIVVISDASTDATDAIVGEFAGVGVELLRLPTRRGKTAAEAAAGRIARGEIIVNMDASVRILPQSIKALVRAFSDPRVGVASGRDRTADASATARNAESGYVGYEMWLRSLETRLGGIVGASGCFYAFRRDIHDLDLPEELSRDFASAMIARERGFRSVSVPDAICVVPQTRGLAAELDRKVRTMARGLETLVYKKQLMNPFIYGGFALKLISHKLCRWLVSLTLPLAVVGFLLVAVTSPLGAPAATVATACVAIGVAGIRWPKGRPAPRLVILAGYVLASNVAGVLAWIRLARRRSTAFWEPTQRPA